MKLLIFITLIFATATANAFDDWTSTNTVLQSTYTVLHVIDWGQTASMAKNGWQTHKETNIVLGENPRPDDVHIYFAATLLAHTAISYALPRHWRETWQVLGIGVEAVVVGNNYRINMNGFF